MNVNRRYDWGPRHFDADFDVKRRILVLAMNRAVTHRTAVGADGRAGSLPPWFPSELRAELARDLAQAMAPGAAADPPAP